MAAMPGCAGEAAGFGFRHHPRVPDAATTIAVNVRIQRVFMGVLANALAGREQDTFAKAIREHCDRVALEQSIDRFLLVWKIPGIIHAANHPSPWILPCTTRLSGENVLRVALPRGLAGNAAECGVMIDQSRAIDNRRFRRALGVVPRPEFREVKETLPLLGDC